MLPGLLRRTSSYLALICVLQLALGLGIVLSFVSGSAFGALVLTVFLGLSFSYLLRDTRRPTAFDLLFTLAALLVAIGYIRGLFRPSSPYDELAHGFLVFSVSLAFFFLFYRGAEPRQRAIAMFTSVCTLGVSFGVLWEIFEWSVATRASFSDAMIYMSLPDTISDLIADSVGALAAGLLALVLRHHNSWLT